MDNIFIARNLASKETDAERAVPDREISDFLAEKLPEAGEVWHVMVLGSKGAVLRELVKPATHLERGERLAMSAAAMRQYAPLLADKVLQLFIADLTEGLKARIFRVTGDGEVTEVNDPGEVEGTNATV